ncbi:MAG: hypothetical protein Q8O26_09380 [Phreatobacter sp.]|uniref:hypothetical protein n=1 Tax=Phreatobacter sp. TaxID=1966341 RepID=UPI002734E79F|nr:hypothetical protein [Phreatobacter sp.]MDP2802082.1 hypothetical protein [Phreatobacter sp.]
MTHIDPKDDRIAVTPTRLDGGRRQDLDPPTDPRVSRMTNGNWGLVGGLAVVLVLGIVIFSMMGGNPSGQSQTTAPAADRTTTGSTPPAAVPMTPGSIPPAAAPMTPGSTPPRQSP